MPKDLFLDTLRSYHASTKAEDHLSDIERRLQQEKTRRHILSQELEKELSDLESLEQMGIRQLFNKILGRGEDQLEKERQEYLLKALEHNECGETIKLLSYEYDILKSKVLQKPVYLKQLEELIKENEDLIADWPESLSRKFQQRQSEKRKIYELRVDIEEIIVVIQSLLKTVDQLIKNAAQSQKLEIWGSSYAEIQKNKALTQSHIDRAYHLSHQTQKLLDDLRLEIEDIRPYVELISLDDMKDFAKFTQVLYRRLIDDWIIENQLSHTQDYLHETKRGLTRISHLCHDQLKSLESRAKVIDGFIEIILESVEQ